MKNCMIKSVLAGSLLLLGSTATGEDVPTPYLAQCVAQLEEDTDLAIELCEAKRARAVLAPGTSDCATSWRLIAGRASCNKSDSASAGAWDDAGFLPYSLQLSRPVSLGTMADFYGGRHAGDASRFEVTKQGDGGLAVVDEQAASSPCIFQPDTHNCRVQGAYTNMATPQYAQIRRDYAYTLQLDGLLVEEEVHRKYCGNRVCVPGVCICNSYQYPPPVKTESLHLWQ